MAGTVSTECRMCGGPFDAPAVTVGERMYGTGEEFDYAVCPRCGSAMLVAIPDDLAPYYPSDYYSLETWDPPEQSGSAAMARRLRLAVALRLPTAAIDRLGVRHVVPHYVRWFAGLGVRPSTPILDVGSGGGHLLTNMAKQGFSNLLGIDPFLERERHDRPVRLLRIDVEDLEETFDVVMINHTLEHVHEPQALLEAAARRLRPGGHLVVRVPAFDSWAVEHYWTDWVAWDPPRHLQLPTAPGLAATCEAARLRIVREFRDGHGFGFWGSEQYRRGIVIRDPRSLAEDPSGESSPFSEEQRREWEQRARALNAEGRGDALTLVLAPR